MEARGGVYRIAGSLHFFVGVSGGPTCGSRARGPWPMTEGSLAAEFACREANVVSESCVDRESARDRPPAFVYPVPLELEWLSPQIVSGFGAGLQRQG